MDATNRKPIVKTPGEVRVRSNVCLEANAWHLVPGDLLKACGLPLRDITTQQQREMMYYERCCICRKTVYVFMEDGCDYCATRGHGVPSVKDAKQHRDARFRADDQRLGKGAFE